MAKLNSSNWGTSLAGKRIALTGHSGFKGTWFTHLLTKLGASVSGFALRPDKNQENLFFSTHTDNIIHSSSRYGDIRDRSSLNSWLEAASPDLLFHFAAQSLVRQSYIDPVETFDTNVMGTVNLLETARHIPSLRAIIVITSDKCYSNSNSGHLFCEDDTLGGEDPYSASKASTELVTQSFRNSYGGSGPKLATARAGNVIGGGDWSSDRLVPDLVRAITEEKTLVLRNPESIRPWQHVLEPLRGYVLLAEALLAGQDLLGESPEGAWNFGPEESAHQSVHEIAKKMIGNWGEGEISTNSEKDTFSEATVLKLNISKAKEKLAFVPKMSLDQAILLTVKWHQTFSARSEKAKHELENQIRDYLHFTDGNLT